MNRRKFIQALLPLPVASVAAGAAIAAPAVQDLQMPVRMFTGDGDALIFDVDDKGNIIINTQLYEAINRKSPTTYKVMQIQRPTGLIAGYNNLSVKVHD